jgi:hypothetical protein
MLEATTKQGFIQDINNPQDTGETVRVRAVLGRHKETTGEHDWFRKGPSTSPTDNETSLNHQLDWQLTRGSALAELKELAANAVEASERRYRQENLTNTILETLASGGNTSNIPQEDDSNATREMSAIAMLSMPSTQFIPEEIDIQATRFEMPAVPKSDSESSGSRRVPTSYENWTLNPRVLLLGAIMENTLHVGPRKVPRCLYVSDDILKQLPDNMKCTSGEDFDGTIPFREFGDDIRIPVLSAREFLGIDLPRQVVWCSN